MGLEDKIPGEGETTLSEMMPASRTLMTKAEFEKLQRDCLLVVSEVLPAGARPCFNENGTWGLNDIENNTPLVLLLTIHSLVFNIGDFFRRRRHCRIRKRACPVYPLPTSKCKWVGVCACAGRHVETA